jgi:hypothetical protein
LPEPCPDLRPTRRKSPQIVGAPNTPHCTRRAIPVNAAGSLASGRAYTWRRCHAAGSGRSNVQRPPSRRGRSPPGSSWSPPGSSWRTPTPNARAFLLQSSVRPSYNAGRCYLALPDACGSGIRRHLRGLGDTLGRRQPGAPRGPGRPVNNGLQGRARVARGLLNAKPKGVEFLNYFSRKTRP